MKLKALVVLVLLGAVLVSASVGTLSGYQTASTFSAAITVDTDKIKNNGHKDGLNIQAADAGLTAPAAADEPQTAEPELISE